MSLIITPALARCVLDPLDLSGVLLRLIATPKSPIGRYNPPPAAHPLASAHHFIHAICDITVVVKKVAQNTVVLVSYYG